MKDNGIRIVEVDAAMQHRIGHWYAGYEMRHGMRYALYEMRRKAYEQEGHCDSLYNVGPVEESIMGFGDSECAVAIIA